MVGALVGARGNSGGLMLAPQPKSKREKIVHLTRADPKGYAGKEKLIGEVRPHVAAPRRHSVRRGVMPLGAAEPRGAG